MDRGDGMKVVMETFVVCDYLKAEKHALGDKKHENSILILILCIKFLIFGMWQNFDFWKFIIWPNLPKIDVYKFDQNRYQSRLK